LSDDVKRVMMESKRKEVRVEAVAYLITTQTGDQMIGASSLFDSVHDVHPLDV
jgi:hypothetical protein